MNIFVRNLSHDGSEKELRSAFDEMNQKDLTGRALNVNEARPKTEPWGGDGRRGGWANRGRSGQRW